MQTPKKLHALTGLAFKHWITTAAIIAAIVACYSVSPISRMESHFNRLVIAVIAILLLCLRITIAQKCLNTSLKYPWTRPLAKDFLYSSLLVLLIFSCFNYYQFDKNMVLKVGDHSDVTYYYLNSKYIHELGYYNLYPAMLIADQEENQRLTSIPYYRDLRSYSIVTRAHAFNESKSIKSNFTPIKWEQFSHDVSFFVDRNATGGWRYFFIDHGYNPPPTWTLIGSALSKSTPVEKIKLITSIDIVLVTGMFVAIFWAFGLEVMLWSGLFFFCTFSGRWPVLGQSLLRFDWLATLTMSVCFLKKNRHGLAGALMTYSALNRVFPAIFFYGYLMWAFTTAIKRRLVSDRQMKFFDSSLVTFMILIGAAYASLGPQIFVEATEKILRHASVESYSSHRVGLGDALLYRGETTREDIHMTHGGIKGKGIKLGEMMPLLRILGACSLIFIAWYIAKTDHHPADLIHLAIIPLFILTTPQINYYNLRILLIIYHASKINRPFHAIALIMLFAIEAVTQYVMAIGVERYAVTATTSIGLLIYLSINIIYYIFEGARVKN